MTKVTAQRGKTFKTFSSKAAAKRANHKDIVYEHAKKKEKS